MLRGECSYPSSQIEPPSSSIASPDDCDDGSLCQRNRATVVDQSCWVPGIEEPVREVKISCDTNREPPEVIKDVLNPFFVLETTVEQGRIEDSLHKQRRSLGRMLLIQCVELL